MREAGRIEIQSNSERPRPFNPVLEMFRFNFVAIHLPAAKLSVASVQVEAMSAGNQRERLRRVRAEFIWCAGLPGIIPRGHNATGQRATTILEAAHVIALPAVQRNRYAGKLLEDGVGVDSEGGVAFASQFVGLLNSFGIAHARKASVMNTKSEVQNPKPLLTPRA